MRVKYRTEFNAQFQTHNMLSVRNTRNANRNTSMSFEFKWPVLMQQDEPPKLSKEKTADLKCLDKFMSPTNVIFYDTIL
jgi:hypothetical protein